MNKQCNTQCLAANTQCHLTWWYNLVNIHVNFKTSKFHTLSPTEQNTLHLYTHLVMSNSACCVYQTLLRCIITVGSAHSLYTVMNFIICTCISKSRSQQPSASSPQDKSHYFSASLITITNHSDLKVSSKNLLTVSVSMTGIKNSSHADRDTHAGHTAEITMPSSLHMDICAS